MSNNIQLLPIGPAIGTIHAAEEVVILDFFNKSYHLDATVFAGLLAEYADITIDKGKYV